MKRIVIIILLVSGSAFIIGAGILFWPLYEFRKYYGQAEPLVQIVWPMADAVRVFVEVNGRRPASMEELDRQSAVDLNELKDYEHRFFPEGPWVFHMTVNRMFGFGIDEEYRPRWTGSDPDTEPGEVVNSE